MPLASIDVTATAKSKIDNKLWGNNHDGYGNGNWGNGPQTTDPTLVAQVQMPERRRGETDQEYMKRVNRDERSKYGNQVNGNDNVLQLSGQKPQGPTAQPKPAEPTTL